MVAHSRVIPYVRIYIYLERWTGHSTGHRSTYTRGAGVFAQFRRYSSTRYLTPPDRHVSRTRRSHPVTTLPRAAAAVDSHFRTPAHKSKTKSAAKTARRDGKRSTRTARSQLAWGAGREDMLPATTVSRPWAPARILSAVAGRSAAAAPDVPQMCPR